MKKLALLFFPLLLMACAMAGPIAESVQREPTADPAKIAVEETLAATAVQAGQTTTPAPTSWTIELLQNGQPVAPQGDTYRLQKAPFTIRVTFHQPHGEALPAGVFINTLENDANYQRVQPGSVLVYDPAQVEADPGAFIFGGGAEPSQAGGSGLLFIDQMDGWISNYLYHYSSTETRWSRTSVLDDGVVFERDMHGIALVKAENDVQEIKLEDFQGSQLYLVFLLDYPDSPDVSADELKKAVLAFQ